MRRVQGPEPRRRDRLIHGASSSSFFRKGIKSDDDWRCFSIFKERTLDLAADSAGVLVDWYLALASLIAVDRAALDEEQLRQRIEHGEVTMEAT